MKTSEEGFDYISRNLKEAIVKADSERAAEEAANENPAKEVTDLFVAGYDKGYKEGVESCQIKLDKLKEINRIVVEEWDYTTAYRLIREIL